jgi:hypothetical protein
MNKLIRTKDSSLFKVESINYRTKKVKAYTFGGGFRYKIPFDKVEDWNAELNNNFDLVSVGFDDGKVCNAFINKDDRWNGWLIPLATFDELKKVKKWMKKGCDNYYTMKIHKDKSISVWITEEKGTKYEELIADRQKPTTYTIDNQEIELYDIGWDWCWDKMEEEA